MAVAPFATKKLIPPGSSDPRITPRVAVLHVDAGNAESLYEYFRDRSGGIEAHFFVKKTGELEQYRDTAFQADAQLDANDFAVSIETQGFGSGEWVPAQLETIKRLLTWLHDTHGIPLHKVQAWNGSGVGYHTMWGAPSHWTPVAKTCPGPDRIRQFEAVLVPWMRRQSATASQRRQERRRLARQDRRRDEVRTELKTARGTLRAARARVKTLVARLARIGGKP